MSRKYCGCESPAFPHWHLKNQAPCSVPDKASCMFTAFHVSYSVYDNLFFYLGYSLGLFSLWTFFFLGGRFDV